MKLIHRNFLLFAIFYSQSWWCSGEELVANYHIGYRVVNWCVTGKDEPELHEWPLSQFVPLLRRTNREKEDKTRTRYDLRFFNIHTKQTELGDRGSLHKTMHVVFKAEKRDPKKTAKKIWEPLPLEGLIIQANSNPYSMALPTGQFFPPGDAFNPSDAEIHCLDCPSKYWARSVMCRKRAKIHVEHPTILAWHHMQKSFNSTGGGGTNLQTGQEGDGDEEIVAPPPFAISGKQSEVHSNFRFYSPKCAATRRMMFTILAVRSFVRHEYDVFHRGPYEITVRDQEFQSDLHPSPYFYMYTQKSICHHQSASDLYLEHPKRFKDFEMNAFFDCCTREEDNYRTKVTLELLGLKSVPSVSCYEKLYKKQQGKFDPRVIQRGKESYMCFYPFLPKRCDEGVIEHAYDDIEPCPPCTPPESTTTETSTSKPYSIYKRTLHGGLMIMTNFCLQPIVIYIARFYKETFNLTTRKGAKSWYWMHLIGGMISSALVYFGYFAGGSSDRPEVRSHVVIGNVYIVTLMLCYMTSWGRNKSILITTIAEFLHACLGYITISLAVVSIQSAPGLQFVSKLLVLLMICTQIFFMIIMTCHICVMDKKFGMRPRRRHFPTVEARFDEIAVPGRRFRIIMLVIFSCITFSLSTASTFVA